MNAAAPIALLTDFASRDVYVGVMKGAIATIAPHTSVIDLTHHIPPQDVIAARFCLASAYGYFPQGTVFAAVVDPGVGSHRRAIAIQLADGFLVGPDNGIFDGILRRSPPIAVVELNRPQFWRTPTPSTTFHGRDIFAPAAAHLAAGISLAALGDRLDPGTLVRLPLAEPTIEPWGARGSIQYIDGFGNAISNIPAEALPDRPWRVELPSRSLVAIPPGQTYSDVAPGEWVALVASHGWVEVAVNGGSARDRGGLRWNDPLCIVWDEGLRSRSQ